ncbi:MAG: hypothetical protein ILO68_07900, partial [Clostridia bacterium]|nr:hypothetical protein [Clostridia bacterium]
MKRTTAILLYLALMLTAVCIFPVSVSAEDTADPVLVAYGDSIAAAGKWETAFRSACGETVLNSGVGGDTSETGLTRFTSAVTN